MGQNFGCMEAQFIVKEIFPASFITITEVIIAAIIITVIEVSITIIIVVIYT